MNSSLSEPVPSDLTTRLKANWQSLALAALGFLPIIGLFFALDWGRPTYQFFPMAIIAAGILAWRELETPLEALTPGSRLSSHLLGGAAVLLFLVSNGLWSPWLGYIAFLIAIVSVLWHFGGKVLLKHFGPSILMLLTILPPPLGTDETLTIWLRHIAVDTSNILLDLLQVVHAQDGNTLLLPGKTLLVEEACSGINSFVLCNAFCLFWVLWQRRSPWWLIPGLLATSCFVVLGNVIRITAGAVGYFFWKVDLLTGWKHESFGLILLLVYSGSILSWDQLMVFFTSSGKEQQDDTVSKNPQQTVQETAVLVKTPSKPIFGFKLLGAVLAALGLGIFAAHLIFPGRHGLAALPGIKSVRELAFSMPASVAGWQRIDADTGDASLVETLGVRSRRWNYQHNGKSAIVAVDYPLDGFHNVEMCYRNGGWQVLAETELHAAQNGEDLHGMELDLQKSVQYAMVLHSVADASGNWLTAPTHLGDRFSDTLNIRQTGYRVQMMTGGYAPISAESQADCLQFFMQARQLLVQQLLEQLQKTAAK